MTDSKDEEPVEDSGQEAALESNEETAGDAAKEVAVETTEEAPNKGEKLDIENIENLLDQATENLDEAAGNNVSPSSTPTSFDLENLTSTAGSNDRQPIDLLGDVEMDLRIELGRTEMRLEEVLALRSGGVVALDKLAGDPVDVFVNGRLVARGEVLVMNDNFCIRVTELVDA
jgi:flagellar motor switch protein FliN/FliY